MTKPRSNQPALLSFVGGLVLGFLVALVRLYGPQPLKGIADFYVWVVRGTPLLVQLFLIFYGLPIAGVTLDAFPAALIGFTLSVGAYSSEIIRGAIVSVPKAQCEAAWAIGMSSTQAMRRVILPQSVFVSIPPLANSFISLIEGHVACGGDYRAGDVSGRATHCVGDL